MNTMGPGVWSIASIVVIALTAAAESQDIGTLSARYDCLFQPHIGGQLINGGIISPDSGQFAHLPVAIGFAVEDAATGVATMQVGKQPGRTVPARLEILDRVLRFSYEFPGLSAGSVTISRTVGNSGFPAVRSDQGWYDGILSVGYSSGLCRTDSAG